MTTRLNALGQPIGEPLDDWRPPPRPSAELLDGDLVRLERLDPGRHARALHDANRLDVEGRNWTYLPIGPFAAFDDYDCWLRSVAAGADPYFFAVVDRATGEPVGVATCASTRLPGRSVSHINFSPRAQRTALASEAMFLMMRHAFALGYRRYEWKCDALNQPSRVAAARLGTFEGVFRRATIYKGRNRDTAWYSILDHEFPTLERAFTAWLGPGNRDAAGRQRSSAGSATPLIAEARRG
ncbi:MAG: GNAT family protein [Vicinamibacterales bacterium]